MKRLNKGSAFVIGAILFLGALFVISLVVKNDDDAPTQQAQGQQSETASNQGGEAPSPSTDVVVDFAGEEWGIHGGDYYNRRYSTLDQITSETIGDLKPTWVTSLGSGTEFKFSGEATPIVQDGVMYISTGANHILALDAKSGEMIWEYVPEIPQEMDTVCCGWTTRGVAVADGKVFAGLLDATLIALDAKTGELLWDTEVANWEEGYTITSAPLYYNGKVFTGVAGGEYGIRGRVMAYDADLGYEVWRFYTVPGPGDLNGDTWPEDNDAYLTGGAPVWNTPAVDPELGLIYFATGNTAPDLDGSNREGDNLYANSVVAVNAENGEYKWHFQQVHHDIWDMDPANPVVLFDVEKDGEMRKGLGQAGKTGWVYFLDRTDGTPLVGIEEKEVPQLEEQKTAATQPFPVGDSFVPQDVTEEDIANDLGDDFEGEVGSIFTPFWEEPITLKPGPQGGANWPPSAYNPDTELFYVLGNDTYFAFARQEDQAFEEGSMYIGSIMQPISNAPQRGTVTALDVKTNKIVWQKQWDAVAYSGVLTTAGNLVFVGHNDGTLYAYTADTGDEVWSYKTDAGANAPAVSYEVDGEQYISIFAAGNSLAGTKHGDKVYTFKLGGTLPEGEFKVAQDTNGEAPSSGGDSSEGEGDESGSDDVVQADTEKGFDIYKSNCLSCHGDQGANGHNGPNLQTSNLAENYDQVVDRVKNGANTMPAFEGVLTEEEIAAVARYVNEVLAPLGE